MGNSRRMAHKRKSRDGIVQVALLLLMMAFAYCLYGFRWSGVAMGSDDITYMASTISYKFLTVPMALGSFGMSAYAKLFVILFGQNLTTPATAARASILITMVLLFLIGRVYGRGASLMAPFLYAFNPLVFMYSSRLYPDLLIAMVASAAMLCVIYADRRKSNGLYFASGMIMTLGLFFALQDIAPTVGFAAFSAVYLFLAKKQDRKEKLRSAAMIALGAVVGFAAFSAPQLILYGDPFKEIVESFAFYRQFSAVDNYANYQYSPAYYVLTLLPLPPYSIPQIEMADANLGTLFVLFVAFLTYGIARDRKYFAKIAPYAAFFVPIISYLLIWSLVLAFTSAVLDVNRLLIPAIPGLSLCVAVAFSHFKDRRMIAVAALIIISSYALMIYSFYDYAVMFYNSSSYGRGMVDSMLQNLHVQNASSYSLYESLDVLPQAPCYVLNMDKLCKYVNEPSQQSECDYEKSILMTYTDYCGPGYFYHNQEYGYYVYVNG
jgi:hypothetical protein